MSKRKRPHKPKDSARQRLANETGLSVETVHGTFVPAYAPIRPLTWVANQKNARKYECESFWDGYFGGNYIGFVMDYGYAAYGYLLDDRLGAQRDVETAKLRVNHRFDKLSAEPETKIVPLPTPPDLTLEELLKAFENRKKD